MGSIILKEVAFMTLTLTLKLRRVPENIIIRFGEDLQVFLKFLRSSKKLCHSITLILLQTSTMTTSKSILTSFTLILPFSALETPQAQVGRAPKKKTSFSTVILLTPTSSCIRNAVSTKPGWRPS